MTWMISNTLDFTAPVSKALSTWKYFSAINKEGYIAIGMDTRIQLGELKD